MHGFHADRAAQVPLGVRPRTPRVGRRGQQRRGTGHHSTNDHIAPSHRTLLRSPATGPTAAPPPANADTAVRRQCRVAALQAGCRQCLGPRSPSPVNRGRQRPARRGSPYGVSPRYADSAARHSAGNGLAVLRSQGRGLVGCRGGLRAVRRFLQCLHDQVQLPVVDRTEPVRNRCCLRRSPHAYLRACPFRTHSICENGCWFSSERLTPAGQHRVNNRPNRASKTRSAPRHAGTA